MLCVNILIQSTTSEIDITHLKSSHIKQKDIIPAQGDVHGLQADLNPPKRPPWIAAANELSESENRYVTWEQIGQPLCYTIIPNVFVYSSRSGK
jgi:hypothetical protein